MTLTLTEFKAWADGFTVLSNKLGVVRKMGDVVQLRDFQNPKDLERLREALEREAAEILKEVAPYGGQGIDGMWTDKDPA